MMRERGDNRACNLRWCTPEQQSRNQKKRVKRQNPVTKPLEGRKLLDSDWTPFLSTCDAADVTGCNRANIGSVCNNYKGITQTNGWTFRWVEPEPQDDVVDDAGNVEKWKKWDDCCLVSSFGRVQYKNNNAPGWKYRFTPKPQQCKPYAMARGQFVHVMVAKLFLPKHTMPAAVVDHITEGNKTNNKFTNLQWISQSENVRKSVKRPIGNDNRDCRKRQVIGICPDGTNIPFASVRSAAEYVHGDVGGVAQSCKKGYRHKGMHFKYA
jgi:hypothetical protein